MKLDDGVWITHTHTELLFFYIKYGFIISILVFLCEDGALWVTGLSLLCTSFINIRMTKDFLFGIQLSNPYLSLAKLALAFFKSFVRV